MTYFGSREFVEDMKRAAYQRSKAMPTCSCKGCPAHEGKKCMSSVLLGGTRCLPCRRAALTEQEAS